MNLKRKAFAAIRATMFSHGVRFLLQLLQVAILARILSPSDFGLMAVVGSFLAILTMLSNFGINRAFIHFREISDDARASLYWLNILIATSVAVVLVAISPVVAMAFSEPALTYVMSLSGLVFPLSALGQQFLVLAEKDLRFSSLAWVEITATLIGIIASILLAIGGFGVFAIVWGVLTTAGVSSLLAWLFLTGGWRPVWRLQFSEISHILRFGAYLVGDKMVGALHREVDIVLGGMIAGSGALGYYSISRNLTLKLATTVINPVVTRVGFPLLARMQHDQNQLKSTFLSMLLMVYSVNYPLYLMLGLFAKDIVTMLYGPGWEQATLYLQVLSVWGVVRSMGNPVGSLIMAVGRTRLAFFWNLALLILTIVMLLIGAKLYGLIGLVWSLVTIQFLIIVPMWRWLVYPLCGAGFKEYIRQPLPPLAISIVSGVISILAVRQFDYSILRLGVGCFIFCVFYLLLSCQFNRAWFDALRTLLTSKNGQAEASVDPVSMYPH